MCFALLVCVCTYLTRLQKKKGKPRDPFKGIVVFPHQVRKARNVLVFTKPGPQADAAVAAGATTVGDADLIAQVIECVLVCVRMSVLNGKLRASLWNLVHKHTCPSRVLICIPGRVPPAPLFIFAQIFFA